MQTKKQSLIESLTNVAIGYFISLISLFIIFPILGIESNTGKNLLITLYFTLISVVRSYVLRRWFNKKKTNNNKYNYGREIIFNLRSCYAISPKVYKHWLEKIDKEEVCSF